MEDQKLFNEIKTFLINEMNVKEPITLESNLKDDLDIDSLSMMDIIFFAEDLTGKDIQGNEFPDITTVESMIEYIKKEKSIKWREL